MASILGRYVAQYRGESLRALRRDLFFADHGRVRRCLGSQADRALCLTLVADACVLGYR